MDQMKAFQQAAMIWGKLSPHFFCDCEENHEAMRARWRCPVHGDVVGRPLADPGYIADLIEYQRGPDR